MTIERRKISLPEVKLAVDETTTGTFSGYGAYFGNEDAYGDVIERGAFAETIREWKARGKWPPMLLQHGGGMFSESPDGMLPVGQWTHMEENSRGLKVEGRLFALNTERGRYIHEGLQSGALDGLSIGYKVRNSRRGTRSGEPERTLLDIDLWEVSIVTFPANDKARITGVKSLTTAERREFEGRLRDEGFSWSQAKKAVAILNQKLLRDEGDPGEALRDEVVPGDTGYADNAAMAADTLLARILGGSLRY